MCLFLFRWKIQILICIDNLIVFIIHFQHVRISHQFILIKCTRIGHQDFLGILIISSSFKHFLFNFFNLGVRLFDDFFRIQLDTYSVFTLIIALKNCLFLGHLLRLLLRECLLFILKGQILQIRQNWRFPFFLCLNMYVFIFIL